MPSEGRGVLLAGFAKADVTPPLAVPYLSYYPRQTPFGGVHDPLFARVLALELEGVAGGALAPVQAALVSLDSLGLSRGVLGPGWDAVEALRGAIERRTGIPGANVLIAASHAHSTPQTTDLVPLAEGFPAAASWLEGLTEAIAGAAAAAWAARRPAEVRGATGHCPGVAWNRRILTREGRLVVSIAQRPADGEVLKEPRDDRLPALLISDATTPPGSPGHWRGAVIGFTCHPTTVQVQPLVSADYPGVACAVVERELGAEACLFLQGACGDVGPVRATTDFRDVAVYGRAVGGEALRVLSLLEGADAPAMPPRLAVGSESVRLDRRPVPDEAALAPRAAALEREIESAPAGPARQEAIARYRRVAEPLRLARLSGPDHGPLRLEVQAIRLGDALIVACEGELFVEYGLRIKEAVPAPVGFVAAYSNGYEGYLPTPAAWDEGGYEVSEGPWTRAGRDGGDVLTAHAIALARRVWDGARLPPAAERG